MKKRLIVLNYSKCSGIYKYEIVDSKSEVWYRIKWTT